MDLEAMVIIIEFAIKKAADSSKASHEWASHQRYQDDSGTDRKLMKKSTILEGQIVILSHPRYVYKQNIDENKEKNKKSFFLSM